MKKFSLQLGAAVVGVGLCCCGGFNLAVRLPYYQGESVPRFWTRRIEDPDPAVRTQAIEAQCAALRSRFREHRVRAIKVLAYYAPYHAREELRVAIPSLLESLRNDEYEYIRYSAAHALGAIGPAAESAVPTLEIAADDDREFPSVRESASNALKKIRLAGKEQAP